MISSGWRGEVICMGWSVGRFVREAKETELGSELSSVKHSWWQRYLTHAQRAGTQTATVCKSNPKLPHMHTSTSTRNPLCARGVREAMLSFTVFKVHSWFLNFKCWFFFFCESTKLWDKLQPRIYTNSILGQASKFCEIFGTLFFYSHIVHYCSLINTRCAFPKCWNCLNKCKKQKERQEGGREGGGGEDKLGCWAILLPGKLQARWIALPTLQETDKVFHLEVAASAVNKTGTEF